MLIAQVILVETSVVSARQRIVVEQLFREHATGDLIDGLSAHENARLAVDVHPLSRRAMNQIAHEDPVGSEALVAQDILAHPAHADARAAVQQAGIFFLDVLLIEKAHNRVGPEQATDFRVQFAP